MRVSDLAALNAANAALQVASKAVGAAVAQLQPPTNPVPPPAAGVYWGAYINGQYYNTLYPKQAPWSNAPVTDPGTSDPWPQFEANAGKKIAVLHFGLGGLFPSTPFPRSSLDLVHTRGAIPCLELETGSLLLTDFTAGKYDAQLAVWASAAAATPYPFLVRLDAEMNGDWYNAGVQARANPQAFVDMWRHVHAAFSPARNVAWHWCPNIDPEGIQTPLGPLYPGDAYVDWTGLNGYSHNVPAGKPPETFQWCYGQSYADLAALAPTKPIYIGEIASVAASRAQFIDDMFSGLPAMPQVRALSWFNWWNADGKAVPEEWPIESARLTQFRAGIASPYYVGRA